MAGAFLDHADEPVRTMGVLHTYDDARHYAENDSFVRAGLVEEWHIREWANIPLITPPTSAAALLAADLVRPPSPA